jgi:hypothetical protein
MEAMVKNAPPLSIASSSTNITAAKGGTDAKAAAGELSHRAGPKRCAAAKDSVGAGHRRRRDVVSLLGSAPAVRRSSNLDGGVGGRKNCRRVCGGAVGQDQMRARRRAGQCRQPGSEAGLGRSVRPGKKAEAHSM